MILKNGTDLITITTHTLTHTDTHTDTHTHTSLQIVKSLTMKHLVLIIHQKA